MMYIHGRPHAGFEVGKQPGNSLARAVVDALKLKEATTSRFGLLASASSKSTADESRQRALETLRKLSRPLRPGCLRPREAHERGKQER